MATNARFGFETLPSHMQFFFYLILTSRGKNISIAIPISSVLSRENFSDSDLFYLPAGGQNFRGNSLPISENKSRKKELRVENEIVTQALNLNLY